MNIRVMGTLMAPDSLLWNNFPTLFEGTDCYKGQFPEPLFSICKSYSDQKWRKGKVGKVFVQSSRVEHSYRGEASFFWEKGQGG